MNENILTGATLLREQFREQLLEAVEIHGERNIVIQLKDGVVLAKLRSKNHFMPVTENYLIEFLGGRRGIQTYLSEYKGIEIEDEANIQV